MARTTLVRTFLRSVCTTLQDISPQYSRWPEQELVVYANYGQAAIAKYLPQAGSRVDAIKLKPGTQQDLTRVLAADIIPGDGSAAADTHGVSLLDINRNQGANGLVPGRVIRVVDRYTCDTNDPDWHTRTATAVKEYLFDKNMPKTFYVSPGVPASPAVWVNVSWLAEPIRIPAGGEKGSEVYLFDGASTTLLGIQDQWVEDLHNYCVAVALLKGSKNFQNLPKSQAHAGLFTASINAQAQVLAGVSPNLKTLPMVDQIGESA
jgi:hypothetical protein